MNLSNKNEEDRILLATDIYKRGDIKNITRLSREFNVPYNKLRNWIQGRQSQNAPRPHTRTLDGPQEEAVKAWIKQLDEAGRSPTQEMILNCAVTILCQNHPTSETLAPTLSKMWLNRFVKRLKVYTRVKWKPKDPKQISAEDVGVAINWFDRLEMAIESCQISPCNIYNMDETGFLIGQGKIEEVITAYPEMNSTAGSSMLCKLVTLVECISANGRAIDPFLVLASKHHLEDWYKDCGLPDDYMIAISNNGYITDELGFEWIQHFNLKTKPQNPADWRLLILNNHGSHITYNFLQCCEENRILAFFLPPHMTHHMQPLDGIPFQQYKHWHSKAVNAAARLGDETFHHWEFLTALPGIRDKTFKPRTIHAGWSGRGIWPFKPSIVIEQLDKFCVDDGPDLEFNDGPEETPPPSLPSSQLSSPKTVSRLWNSIVKAKSTIAEIEDVLEEQSPCLQCRLHKVFQGSLHQAEQNTVWEAELNCYLKAARRRNRKTTCRQVKIGGPLYVRDANRRIDERKAEDSKKEWNRRQREWTRHQQAEAANTAQNTSGAEIIGEIAGLATGDQENLNYFIDTRGAF